MQITLSLTRPTVPAVPSQRVLRVAAMFGLGVDESKTVTVVPPVTLTLAPGQLIFITGPSGGGKSTLLRLIAGALAGQPLTRVIAMNDLPPLPDLPIVDCLARIGADAGTDTRDRDDAEERSDTFDNATISPGLAQALTLLSLAGLSDAFLLLRRPCELSDGQRARLRLAQLLDVVARPPVPAPALTVILADEFGVALDRVTARTIARAIRRWTRRCAHPVCFIAATAHDDLLEPFDPDILMEKGLGPTLDIASRPAPGTA